MTQARRISRPSILSVLCPSRALVSWTSQPRPGSPTLRLKEDTYILTGGKRLRFAPADQADPREQNSTDRAGSVNHATHHVTDGAARRQPVCPGTSQCIHAAGLRAVLRSGDETKGVSWVLSGNPDHDERDGSTQPRQRNLNPCVKGFGDVDTTYLGRLDRLGCVGMASAYGQVILCR